MTKTGVSGAPQKGLMSSKKFFKKDRLEVKHPIHVSSVIGVDQSFPHTLRSSEKRSCVNWEGMTSPIKHQLLLLHTKHVKKIYDFDECYGNFK